MSTTTTNYGLIKPERSDNYNVDVMGNNMDKIDSAMKAQDTRISTIESEVNGDLVCNSVTANTLSGGFEMPTLSYNGTYTITFNGGADEYYDHDCYTCPIMFSPFLINGKVSIKHNGGGSATLVSVGPNGITSNGISTTQTEYTITDAYSIFVHGLIYYTSSAKNKAITLTIGKPVFV